jgi:hypothetical protein
MEWRWLKEEFSGEYGRGQNTPRVPEAEQGGMWNTVGMWRRRDESRGGERVLGHLMKQASKKGEDGMDSL